MWFRLTWFSLFLSVCCETNHSIGGTASVHIDYVIQQSRDKSSLSFNKSVLRTHNFTRAVAWKKWPLHRYSLVVLPPITLARKTLDSNSSYNYSTMFSWISRSLNIPSFLGIFSSVLSYSYRFLRNATFNWYPKKYISSFILSSALALPLPKSWTYSKVAKSNTIRYMANRTISWPRKVNTVVERLLLVCPVFISWLWDWEYLWRKDGLLVEPKREIGHSVTGNKF
jgi:hypothetical protein